MPALAPCSTASKITLDSETSKHKGRHGGTAAGGRRAETEDKKGNRKEGGQEARRVRSQGAHRKEVKEREGDMENKRGGQTKKEERKEAEQK